MTSQGGRDGVGKKKGTRFSSRDAVCNVPFRGGRKKCACSRSGGERIASIEKKKKEKREYMIRLKESATFIAGGKEKKVGATPK